MFFMTHSKEIVNFYKINVFLIFKIVLKFHKYILN